MYVLSAELRWEKGLVNMDKKDQDDAEETPSPWALLAGAEDPKTFVDLFAMLRSSTYEFPCEPLSRGKWDNINENFASKTQRDSFYWHNNHYRIFFSNCWLYFEQILIKINN